MLKTIILVVIYFTMCLKFVKHIPVEYKFETLKEGDGKHFPKKGKW